MTWQDYSLTRPYTPAQAKLAAANKTHEELLAKCDEKNKEQLSTRWHAQGGSESDAMQLKLQQVGPHPAWPGK